MKRIYLLLLCSLTLTLAALAQSAAITASILGQTCSCKTSPQSSLQANGLNQEYGGAVTVNNKVDINHDFLLHSEGDVNRTATNNAISNEPISGNEALVDTDGDGVQDASDCAPSDATRWRQVLVYTDADGDGYTTGSVSLCIGTNPPAGFTLTQSASFDCNDNDANMWRQEVVYIDKDGDGYTHGALTLCIGTNPPAGYTLTQKDDDCNDNDASVWQQRPVFRDADGDGYNPPFTGFPTFMCIGANAPAGYTMNLSTIPDCNDNVASVWRQVLVYTDADGDGYTTGSASLCIGTNPPAGFTLTQSASFDCNDNDANMWRQEVVYIDKDGDGYTHGALTLCIGTNPPAGYTLTQKDDDCNDNDASVWQQRPVFRDADGDGYNPPFTGFPTFMCIGANAPAGYTINLSTIPDCNDNVASEHPGQTWYIDGDGDGYAGSSVTQCLRPAHGFLLSELTGTSDCNDNNPLVQTLQTWYLDADGDTHYVSSVSSCGVPGTGYTTTGGTLGDCDDHLASVWQSALLYMDTDGDGYDAGTATVCYGQTVPSGYSLTTKGTDCNDGNVAVFTTNSFYVDGDGDGYGKGFLQPVCHNGTGTPTGYSNNNTDCDDGNIGVWQSASLYVDVDGDGYDAGRSTICYGASVPTGYKATTSGTDCNDNVAAINPGALEICGNNIDDNCNGIIDENCISVCSNATAFSTTNITGSSAQLNWTAVTNTVQWQVRYKTTKQGSKWIDVLVNGDKRTVTISPLLANQNYMWQIRAKCGTIWTEYSGANKFETLAYALLVSSRQANATEANITINDGKAIQLYPNPSTGRFQVLVRLSKSMNANAKIELFSTSGQAVFTSSGFLSNGILQTTVQLPVTVASGMYVVKVTTANEVQQTKLMYSKN